MRQASFSRRLVFYLLCGVTASLVAAAGHRLDVLLGDSGWVVIAVRALLVAAGLLLLRRVGGQEVLLAGPFVSPWLALALAPLVIHGATCFGPVDRWPASQAVAVGLLGVVLTALWEECFFRGLAVTLFVKEGRLPWAAALGTSAVFGACHAVNLFFDKPASVAVQVLFALACGLFFLGLALRTRHLFVAVVAHVAVDFVAWFFPAFSTSPVGWGGDTLLAVEILLLAGLGIGMIWPSCQMKE